MLQKTTPEPEEPNPFEDFTSAELCAFVYRKHGAAGLREFLSDADDESSTREFYEDAAATLMAIGLAKAAAIVAEVAAQTPSRMGFERCRYMQPRPMSAGRAIF